jgi:hypothetical protein
MLIYRECLEPWQPAVHDTYEAEQHQDQHANHSARQDAELFKSARLT